jgi:hypothetical protein
VDQTPPRIEVFRYITDVEAAAAKKAGIFDPTTIPAAANGKTTAPAKAPQPTELAATPPVASGPTVEELKKELADLKAKLAAQEQQKPDAAKPEAEPAQEAPSSPPR